jgi:arginase
MSWRTYWVDDLLEPNQVAWLGVEDNPATDRGPTLDQVGMALEVAVRDDRFRALSIGELNPTRSAGDPDAIPRFVAVVASILASAHS